MCLVKVKGEVDDEVIVPARVAERDVTETTIVETRTQPTVIRERFESDRRSQRRSRRGSSSSSSSSASSSSPPRSVVTSRSRRSGYHEGSLYGDRQRSDDKPRNSYRYVEPPSQRGSQYQVKEEISKAEEHLQRAAELQERERRMAANRKSIGYDPRSSQASYRSYGGNQGRGRQSAEVVVVQESTRSRYY